MEVMLKVLAGAHKGKQIRLTKSRFLIGRAEECHLRAGSDLISRKHCAIVNDGSAVLIEDFGSKNGSKVNGERVEGKLELHSGDRLQVGPLDFEVIVEHGVGKPKKPAVKDVTEAAARSAQQEPNVEDSISDWIGSPTGKLSHMVGTADTQAIKSGDTEAIKEGEEGSEEEEGESEGKTSSGKSPGGSVPKSRNSREAAANILRELARRR